MAEPSPSPRARALLRKLRLEPHPEGGFYREIHRARQEVVSARGTRSALTTIYFLLLRGQRSRFHKVASDEVWHHYEGSPLRLLRLDPSLRKAESLRLGPLAVRTAPVAVIPAGWWQAAEPMGDYALVGCDVGPGFDFADFALIGGRDADTLRRRHPALARFA